MHESGRLADDIVGTVGQGGDDVADSGIEVGIEEVQRLVCRPATSSVPVDRDSIGRVSVPIKALQED